jgi:formylglycine-generating enzyme required for sulfatase activity
LAQHLAFAMHSKGEKQGREISEDELKKILKKDPAHAPLMNDFVQLTRLRGTLLEERLGTYRFIHLAFQEYLAARYLAEVIRGENGVSGIAAFLESGPVLDSWWREPALLTVGYLSITSPHNSQLFLRRLAGIDKDAAKRNTALSPDVQMVAAELAASAYLEWQPEEEELRRALAKRIAGLFADKEMMNAAKALLRVAAGNALARLNDPRPEVISIEHMQFCCVPAGPFWMGSPDEDELAWDDEKPLHLNETLKYDYWISRYPLTAAQFKEFVDQTHFKPGKAESVKGAPNHPLVYVSWHEAGKFCQWLTEKWQREGKLPKDRMVRLPTEAEWEKAARGGLQIPSAPVFHSIKELAEGNGKWVMDDSERVMIKNPYPQRRYPWGKDPDANLMNYRDTGIGSTSAVGCFPGGAGLYGCEEMSGNVWEWCQTKWRDNYKTPADESTEGGAARVFRGGAFFYDLQRVRCASRHFNLPDLRHDYGGFRVVLSPYL